MVGVVSEGLAGAALLEICAGVNDQAHYGPLIVVHSAHGNVAFLRRYARPEPEFPIWGLVAPDEIPPTVDHYGLAMAYVRLVKLARPRGPYRLAGYCAGAAIAHEMALELRRLGDEVPFLGMLDLLPPRDTPVPDESDVPGRVPSERGLAAERLAVMRQALAGSRHGAGHDEFVEYLKATDAIDQDLDRSGVRRHFRRWARLTLMAMYYTPSRSTELLHTFLTPQQRDMKSEKQAQLLRDHWSAPGSRPAPVHVIPGAAGLLYRTRGFRAALSQAMTPTPVER